MNADATLDLLLDCKHDLGKYLLLPIALLPKSAGDAAVRDALRRALQQTRKRGAETLAARALWQEFEAQLACDPALSRGAGLADLRAAVARALDWERALDAPATLDRAALERDFIAVQSAIAALIAEVQRG